ncbi:aliphatic sulfonate ABC transporter substrate-binding protein [Auritidibacter ignavus]|uniref:aliphatic sulfonate ABC transporter substrate-binding protein n=1 Tax=Auritidibacter ignavus TaxID=678932 RepID=UPI002448C16E|nr:aliphatic sulfonate ABC transporter substrate-binding protein [Auritidibacter ignavus]WGH82945.1 aliphatic sulfonate ABC transporter substrate-binding protein [Auritidibacter ignavus]
MRSTFFRGAVTVATTVAASVALSGCLVGEGSGSIDNPDDTLTLDYATYSPLSLIIKEHGWLEEELTDQGVSVEWVYSAGSNRANENLRAEAIDVGSAAGSASLLNRANGAPVKTIAITNQPEWSALVTAEGSDVSSVEDLAGGTVAATRGTDPFFFVVQALQEHGVDPDSVEIQNLQHADGRQAMEQGSVDAWAGLDPIMAGAEAEGAQLMYRDVDLNTYNFLNATEEFIEEHPDRAQLVVDTYERARDWALQNPEETAEILAEEAGIEIDVAETVIFERSNLDISPVPGEDQLSVLSTIGPIFVDTGDVDRPEHIETALDEIFEPRFAEQTEEH